MTIYSRPKVKLAQFRSRDDARRRAVADPGDVNLMLSGLWPPYSRDELKALPRKLGRGRVTGENALAELFLNRLKRAANAINNRIRRYRETQTWSVRAPNGTVLEFPLNDESSIAFKKMADQYGDGYERALIDFMTARLDPGDVFVDVGANIGYISAFAASTGAVVFAMEIQRDLLPLIEQMATINGFDQLRVLHVGASTRSGLSMMPRFEGNPGTQLEGQRMKVIRHEARSVVDDIVPMMTLDDAFTEPGLLPKLIKIDVEGHEIGVLEGARRIIETGQTNFVVEFHPHLVGLYRRRHEDLLAPFAGGRWAIYQLTDDGLRRISGLADIRPDPHDPNPKLIFEPAAS